MSLSFSFSLRSSLTPLSSFFVKREETLFLDLVTPLCPLYLEKHFYKFGKVIGSVRGARMWSAMWNTKRNVKRRVKPIQREMHEMHFIMESESDAQRPWGAHSTSGAGACPLRARATPLCRVVRSAYGTHAHVLWACMHCACAQCPSQGRACTHCGCAHMPLRCAQHPLWGT